MVKGTLTKPEWLIMEALWTHSPMFLSELMDAMSPKVKWAHTTYLSYLKKMIAHGYIEYETVRGSRSYSPAISREDCVMNESRSLMSRLTEDSARLFVTNMLREGSLTDDDRESLKNLIDELAAQDKERNN